MTTSGLKTYEFDDYDSDSSNEKLSDDFESEEDNNDDEPYETASTSKHSSTKISQRTKSSTSSNINSKSIKKPAYEKRIDPCGYDQIPLDKSNPIMKWLSLILLLVIIMVSCAVANLGFPSSKNITEVQNETRVSNVDVLIKNFENNIDEISHKFKSQDSDAWFEIAAGVIDIVKHPEKISVVVLFSKNDYIMSCLAKMIANASKEILHVEKPLHLTSSNLGNDYGSVIHEVEQKVKNQRIVIVENLLDVNVEAIRAFHSFCDAQNPIVSQALYIITMVTDGYKDDQRPIDFIEKQLLHKLEGKMAADKIQPLITRITDGALMSVHSEPNIISCPLRY